MWPERHEPCDIEGDCSGLSVIIVSYNTRSLTLPCLEAAWSECSTLTTDTEIWLVDNASQDGSVEAVRAAFPSVRILANRLNIGFSAANNQALRQARGEFVLLLNSDAFLHSGAIETLWSYMKAHPKVAVVGPRLVNPDETLQPSCYRFPGPFRTLCENLLLTALFPNSRCVGDFRRWPHDAVRDDVDFVIGACLLVRREAITEVGLLDESFFLYGEEADWCFRMKRAGWQIAFTPQAVATHCGGASGKAQSAPVFCEFRRAQERFQRKHYGRLGLLFFRMMLLIGAVLRVILFGMQALLLPTRRSVRLSQVHLWQRIFLWTVGMRSTGLQEMQEQGTLP